MESYALGKTLVQQAREKIGAAVPSDLAIVFASSNQNYTRLMKGMQGVPFIGFETYGEICLPSLFFEGFLNTTSVVVILPD